MDTASPALTDSTPESLRQEFTLIDYAVLGAFLLSSALIGVFFGWKERNNKNSKNYLTGDRNLQTFPVVMSLAASFMSTNTILGVPAEVYTLGTQFLIGMVSFTIAVFLSAEVFLPVFYDLNMTSVNEYLFLRFKSVRVRSIGSFSFILCTVSDVDLLSSVLEVNNHSLERLSSLPPVTCCCSCLTWRSCFTVHRLPWLPSRLYPSPIPSSLLA